MGKNNSLINRERAHARQVKELVPKFYASVAIALHRRYGFGPKRIQAVMADMSELWENHKGSELLQMCSDETGVVLITDLTQKETGVKGDAYV